MFDRFNFQYNFAFFIRVFLDDTETVPLSVHLDKVRLLDELPLWHQMHLSGQLLFAHFQAERFELGLALVPHLKQTF